MLRSVSNVQFVVYVVQRPRYADRRCEELPGEKRYAQPTGMQTTRAAGLACSGNCIGAILLPVGCEKEAARKEAARCGILHDQGVAQELAMLNLRVYAVYEFLSGWRGLVSRRVENKCKVGGNTCMHSGESES